MTRNRLLAAGGALLLVLLIVWFSTSGSSEAEASLLVPVAKGPFVVSVTTTGELQAKNSIEIQGPEGARSAGIWQMKIANLVPEGTVVDSGDFVAELDRSEITQKMKDSELSVEKFQSQYDQAILDSTLALSQARDELVNLRFALEEKKIAKEQSIYEAPAMQRQAEIDYERAQRAYAQARKNYVTKQKQSVAKIRAVELDLIKEKNRRDILQQTLMQFRVSAPAPGMVIYAREWDGKKRIVGSMVNPWSSTVATLPDLTEMESITYVNEVDIQKVRQGQSVNIRLDADPDKKLTGKITSVANIGEQRPNADAKVFEVKIVVHESDTTLRPAMTTSNEIVVEVFEDVLSVPLEAIHTEGERSFVYKENGSGITRQEVGLGTMNENAVIVERGLTEGDIVHLSVPRDLDGIPTDTLQALPPVQ